MRTRLLHASILAAAMGLSIMALPASADVTPSPAPTSTLSPQAQYELELEQYREDLKEFKIARAAYDRQLIAIAVEFTRALERAARDAKAAGKGATTKANLAAARAQAALTRDAAVAALGLPPVPPMAPQKPMKMGKFKSPTPRPEKKN
ncbi:unannotated protein [freshwater metagenome]|uniref:Unannotated protein n=1 Tax=freshwater metagenome TaxID=449393 RepID=A0A6J6JQE5_9ZZZZ|nr:hypothetical protein [Actinomycetota bacterium]